jgi:hypothetical protein
VGRRPHAVLAIAAILLVLTGCTVTGDPVSVTGAPEQPTVEPEPTPTDGPTSVVTIAGVDVDGLHVTVAGYVTLVAESGGECLFTLTSAVSGETVTRTTVGAENVDSTSCGTEQIPIAEVSKGPWDATLTYTSGDLTSISGPLRVEVP